MEERRLALLHGFAALTLLALVLLWGSILSPPMAPLREALGIGELPGTRLVDGRFEIINPDTGEAYEFLGRVAQYYHVIFALLLYGTMALAAHAYPRLTKWDAPLALALIGSVMTLLGGIGYAYFIHEPEWHGLFIGGLAVMFASAILAIVRSRPKTPLEWGVVVAGVLLLLGGLQGGYIGSNFINSESFHSFKDVVIETRFDPGLGDKNELWRARTGHLHAMVATSLALAFLVVLGMVELRQNRIVGILQWIVIPSMALMSLASYAVWLIGKQAHLLITPSAVILIATTLALSFTSRAESIRSLEGSIAWALRIGNIGIWLFVAIPGALVAMSLREPSIFFDPEFRSPAWDWAEMAFNIGHWHVLILAWGVVLIVGAVKVVGLTGAKGLFVLWGAVAGFVVPSLGFVLYFATAEPQPYSLNPYDNLWVKLLIEPGLIVLTLSIIILYLAVVKRIFNRGI